MEQEIRRFPNYGSTFLSFIFIIKSHGTIFLNKFLKNCVFYFLFKFNMAYLLF